MRLFTVLLGAAVMPFGTAAAADMSVKAPLQTPVIDAPASHDWAGFYLGADLGGGWGRHNRTVLLSGFRNSYNATGIVAGAHAGYNWQMQAIVFGLEGDLAHSSVKGNDIGIGSSRDQTKLKWLGSLRGRVGYAWGRVLLFATGGWAYGSLEHTNYFGAGQTFMSNRSGWTVGGGVEFAIDANWSVRVDYRHYDFGTYQNLAPTNGVFPFEVANTVSTVTGGVSYRF